MQGLTAPAPMSGPTRCTLSRQAQGKSGYSHTAQPLLTASHEVRS